MTDLRSRVNIDHKHTDAICAEIGWRLGLEYQDIGPAPPHLLALVYRLKELDRPMEGSRAS